MGRVFSGISLKLQITQNLYNKIWYMTIICQIRNMYTTLRRIESNIETNFEYVHTDISFPRVKTNILANI